MDCWGFKGHCDPVLLDKFVDGGCIDRASMTTRVALTQRLVSPVGYYSVDALSLTIEIIQATRSLTDSNKIGNIRVASLSVF